MLYWILVAYLAIPDLHIAVREFPTEIACKNVLIEYNENTAIQLGECITNEDFNGEGDEA